MKVFVVGDFCARGRVAPLLEQDKYNVVFQNIRELTTEADYSVVNLECPVVKGDARPIEKNGPSLKCTSKALDALLWSGFNCVTLGNNHILDYGTEGIENTINELKKKGLDYVGAGKNLLEASRILYKEVDDLRLAIINCCEHEFSIATEISAGANPLNPVQQYNVIQEAKEHADRILIIVHGGHEHFQLPSPRMVETYRFFIDSGADAVVNHHQHCYSGYEVYKGKPIIYGLGNFCFDSFGDTSKEWVEGYAVTLDFSGDNPDFSIHPYRQCAEDPKVEVLNQGAFDERIKALNLIIETPGLLKKAIDDYYSRCVENYSNIFEPFYNRLYLGAKHRKWLPSLINKKRILAAYNFIICEAHRDKLMWWLEKSK
ncbi:MAG: hypothetical protein CW336_04080 [Bacteroidetes bacterium]|nr:hypothetical protein [Bacteroidota bacterium]